MKKISAILFTALFIITTAGITGCSRGLRYKPTDYAPEIQFIDSLRNSTVGPEYPQDVTTPPDSLLRSWVGFAERFSAEDWQEAYDFTMSENNFGNILVWLRNTTAQYEFIVNAWSSVLFETKEINEFYEEMSILLSLNLAMVKTVVASGDEGGYIPPHYTDLLRAMGLMYRLTGDFESCEAFCDEIYNGYKACGFSDVTSRLAVLYFRSQFLTESGNAGQALQETNGFREVVLKESSPEELESSLRIIDEILSSISEKTAEE
ncbi:MAG: hypothetical protein Q4G10_06445 [Bacteroidia bacterium]|nr:hypothetical protein [Bacteroidia bacterium]